MKEDIHTAVSGIIAGPLTDSYYLRMALLCSAAAVLTMGAAHIRIHLPFTPVPVTMQTFMVLVASLALGSTAGSISQVQYLAIGALGLPAFAGGIGALAGPTGGYLVGFVVAAAITGAIYSANRTTGGAVVACTAGIAAIYTFGCLWLAVLTGGGISEIVTTGVLPFLPGAVIKVGAAVAVVRAPITRNLLERIIPDNSPE